MADTVEIKDGGKTIVLTLAVAQSDSRGGNPQLKPSSLAGGYPPRREVQLIGTGDTLPLFGSFALGLTPTQNGPVKVTTMPADSTFGGDWVIVNGKAYPRGDLATVTTPVSAPKRGVGRPRKVTAS